jgi:hypothetical protein
MRQSGRVLHIVAMVSVCILCGMCSKVEQAVEQQSCNTPAEADSSTLVYEINAWFALGIKKWLIKWLWSSVWILWWSIVWPATRWIIWQVCCEHGRNIMKNGYHDRWVLSTAALYLPLVRLLDNYSHVDNQKPIYIYCYFVTWQLFNLQRCHCTLPCV